MRAVFSKIDRKGILRFLKYTSVGVGTFAFDLVLLYAFIEFFEVQYLVATAVAFVLAVSLNFFISSHFVFRGFTRTLLHAYIRFLGAASFALFAITALMFIAVDVFAVHFLVARILVAAVVGFCNYLFNLYLTFQVHGKHH
jgi:putative flippase GtrA